MLNVYFMYDSKIFYSDAIKYDSVINILFDQNLLNLIWRSKSVFRSVLVH